MNYVNQAASASVPAVALPAAPTTETRSGNATEISPTSGFTASSISVVFPAFNEELNIEKSIVKAREAMARHFDKVEIVVVNDGSSDGTYDILERLKAASDDLTVIHFPVNRGYGSALRTGLYAASNELVFFSDSDLQFDLEEISLLLEWIDRYDIVAGYRAHRADPFNRRLNAWGWRTLVRFMLGLKVRDLDCAFKLFRRRVFETIQVQSVGAMINTEILSLSHKHGMTIKEVPVSHFARVAGTQTGAKLSVILRAFRELLKMRRSLKLA